MTTVILVIHLLLAIAMIATVLLQRSEGGALGMGGGGGGGGGFMTGRSAANMLTRTTAILAGCFMVTSLVLSILASNSRTTGNLLDQDATQPVASEPVKPVEPASPAAPLAK
ncbi:MAG: preprotein translocase subunit SecG [Rhodospirillales bacterium]|nr:preprotein translocase subunit SecG [Rhodospirillales bacterium]